jgi:dTDP-4-dehydrorhamnose reductase
MSKPTILITGANGQLGQEFKSLADSFPQFQFLFTGRDQLTLENDISIINFFRQHSVDYCINCAAYTAVDKAETEYEKAYQVNALGVSVLAAQCEKHKVKLIHISTDYVFNGQSPNPYKESDVTDPVNKYGQSKLAGEQFCLQQNPSAIIIRTAWVYSEFGNNFVKTMLRLMKDRDSINVVNDQVGAPTYAADLANGIMKIIAAGKWEAGIYHYSNLGKISWFDFAVAIQELSGLACKVNPIPSASYPTPAKRPSFSLLDTNKIREQFGIGIPDWKPSLEQCLKQLKAKA